MISQFITIIQWLYTFLITEERLNLGVISAVITVFIKLELSDCRKFLRIRPSEIECENKFSSLSQYNYPLNTFLRVVLR